MPVTEIGRVCGTSASSAPSVTTSWVPSASASSMITAAERAPPEGRLVSDQQDQVARGAGHARLVQLDLRPLDPPGVAVDQLDLRARALEVVELLGVDRREPPRAERAGHERDRARGRVRRVVPALERADQRRRPQSVRAIFPLQRLHPTQRRSWAHEFRRFDRGARSAACARGRRSTACSRARARTVCSRAAGRRIWRSELRDRSGTIPARAFQEADSLAGRFERGDLVRVSGRVERFRDEPVLEVVDIARVMTGGRVEADPARFLPTAYRDLDELDGFLEHLAGEVDDRRLPRVPRGAAGR